MSDEKPIEKPLSDFAKMRELNVSEYVEKKGKFNYLSWCYAIDQLLLNDSSASWEYGAPWIMPDNTMLIYCTVHAFSSSRTMQLPVMDNRNEPVASPNAFQINTAMQRCLVKAIALHGIGLYIYAGEDLPDGERADIENAAAKKKEDDLNKAGQANEAKAKELLAKSKSYVADFAEKMSLVDEAGFIDLMAASGEQRGWIAARYPDLVVSIDKAMQLAESRIKGVLDDSIPY